MATNQPPLPAFLKDIHLFSTLDEGQIARIQTFFTRLELGVDTPIIKPGDLESGFYIIYQGQVALSEQIRGGRTQMNLLVEGDFFGEEAFLAKRPHSFSARATTAVVLLVAHKANFDRLLAEFPIIKDDLVNSIESRRIIDAHHFNWLDDDEVIYQVRRHHPVILLLMLILPGLVVGLGLFFAWLSWNFWDTVWARNLSLIIAAVALGIGLGWTIWNWIDWGNDYFVITNQRVVCLEVIIGLYESRNEAPMDTILSLDSRTSFLGRRLGYGNVLVKTFTTQLVLDSVSNPKQLAAVINEHRDRAKRNLQKADYQAMLKSVRYIIGSDQAQTRESPLAAVAQLAGVLPAPLIQSTSAAPAPAAKIADQPIEPGFWTKYFGGIFKTRTEQGLTITYRKHWYDLLRRAGWPTLIILGLFSLVLLINILYIVDRIRFVSPYLVTGLGFVVFLFILFPWWLYNYIDWRNDIYQVTDRSIFDIERRPFGTETRKSAPLENILTLEYERLGFLGYILNVGNVIIDIGEAKFCFNDVYNPARVQQDIFSRMQQMRYNKQQEEINRERDRILKLLDIYHQEMSKEKPS